MIAINHFLELIRRAEEIAEWARVQREAGRDKEIPTELARICQQEVGLPFSVVQRLAPEELSELLRRSGNSRERSVLLAGLLALEAEFDRNAGDAVGHMRASLQAFCLLGEAMEGLPANECGDCRIRLDDLAVSLRGLADDPYVRQKLSRFGCDAG